MFTFFLDVVCNLTIVQGVSWIGKILYGLKIVNLLYHRFRKIGYGVF